MPPSTSSSAMRDAAIGFHKTNTSSDGEARHNHARYLAVNGVILNVGKVLLQISLASAIFLHVLNQRHLLPRPISRVVSKMLFWPTLPMNKNVLYNRPWMTEIDETVMLGGAPFGFLNMPEKLNGEHDVRAVINMCEEYRGPLQKYKQLGIRQLWLPTVDHFEPSLEHLKKAVEFLEEHEALNKRVYVHCKIGHGRSAAVVFAWMLYKHPNANPEFLNKQLCNKRHVRKTLWKQPNLQQFHSWILKKEGNRFCRSASRRASNTNLNELESLMDAEVNDQNSDTNGGDGDSSDEDRDYQLWKKYNNLRESEYEDN